MAPMKPIPKAAIRARSIIFSEQGLSIFDYDSGSRRQAVVRTKEVLAWIGREKMGMSLGQIAKLCGWRSHSTVLAAVERIESDIVYMPNSLNVELRSPKVYATHIYEKAVGKPKGKEGTRESE